MPLSAADKERVKYHLGYQSATTAASLVAGSVRPTQTLFLVESAVALLTDPNAINRVICLLDTLDATEKRLMEIQKQLALSAVGNLKFRDDPGALLEREYKRWAGRLADALGVPFYPFSERHSGGNGYGMIRRGR